MTYVDVDTAMNLELFICQCYVIQENDIKPGPYFIKLLPEKNAGCFNWSFMLWLF